METTICDRRMFSRYYPCAKSFHYERNLASRVLKGFLPLRDKTLHGIELAGTSIHCSGVGGDYFDYLYDNERRQKVLKVIVGDVAGHGIDAALLMSSARSFIHARTAILREGPAEVVNALNSEFSRDVEDTGHFMTLFCLEINLERKTCYWVRAGHDPAIVYFPEGEHFCEFKGRGVPVGVDKDHVYKEYRYNKVLTGSIILIGTDGLWEASNVMEEPFGKQRLKSIIKDNADQGAREIVDQITKELQFFCFNVPLVDDVTFVVIKVL